MDFVIKGKVALITGGGSGIGLCYGKELLRNGAKGVVLADVNPQLAQVALKEIKEEFGDNRAVFIRTDVTRISDVEEAFKKAIQAYNQIDILINNAGILNDSVWEKEVAINVNGVIHGLLLGIEKYFPKYKSDKEAVIVNVSSIAGIMESPQVPIYTGTKHAVIGLTRSWGEPRLYEKTGVRVISICPGVTITPLITEMAGRSLGDKYEEFKADADGWPQQEPPHVAKSVMEVIKRAPTGTVWIIEGGEPPYQYIFAEKESMKHQLLSKL